MTHKPFITIVLLFLSTSSLYAQKSTVLYWQQEVNYKINVSLNDKTSELTGDIEMEYINNSPDNLSFIWMHLWPNAYKNINTAFAKQELENGKTKFLYSKAEDKGYIDHLDFKVNGENVQFAYDSVNIDIGKITLSQPLKSGGRITITTPFHVKLPYTFSRGGHVGQSYQISQWYPKPAVYDMKGWHPFPYLEQGEFYAEYGSFDVHITIPGNYVVGATGDLQNEKELKWLDIRAAYTKQKLNLPMTAEDKRLAAKFDSVKVNYDSTLKTLHYVQHRIHDFAWFADKNYYVLKSGVKLPHSGNWVTTWLMFNSRRASVWKDATTYIDSSIYYYSKWLGDYPYKQATAVTGALEAGDGMEYPNVTVIGDLQSASLLEVDIAHEIGHNWLYGILGFNERDYPWMDEGINSYYENRYIEKRHPGKMIVDPKSGIAKLFDLKNLPNRDEKYLIYLFQERRHEDQPADLKAAEYSSINYPAIIYSKVPFMLIHLAASLGQQRFDTIMQRMFEDWKFKHPQPEDFKQEFVTQTKVDLDWFFDQSMKTTLPLDYRLLHDRDTMHIANSVYQKIGVENARGIKAPYSISAIKDGKVVSTQWYGGFNGKMDVLFPYGDYDKFQIDAGQNLWESDRKNNIIRTHGLFRKTEPLRLQFLVSAENPERTQIFFSPAGGWNNYNGWMAGLAFYNSLAPVKNVEYELLPMYAFKSQTFAGIGRTAFHFYPHGNLFHEIVFTVTGSRFSYDDTKDYFLQYNRLCGRLDFKLKNKTARSKVDKGFTLRSVFIQKDFPQYSVNDNVITSDLAQGNTLFTILSFHIANKRTVNPYSLSLNIENGKALDKDPLITLYTGNLSYTKFYVEGNYYINYNFKATGLGIRVFAGTEIHPADKDYIPFHLAATTGSLDYMIDELYLGRSESQGFLSQQFTMTDGAMKYRSDALISPLGSSTSILAVNLRSGLPFKIPFFLFFDLGAYSVQQSSTITSPYSQFQYDGGVGITLINKVCDVYFPFIFSNDIKNNINTIPQYSKWYNRILFTFNISKFNPFNKIRNFEI